MDEKAFETELAASIAETIATPPTAQEVATAAANEARTADDTATTEKPAAEGEKTDPPATEEKPAEEKEGEKTEGDKEEKTEEGDEKKDEEKKPDEEEAKDDEKKPDEAPLTKTPAEERLARRLALVAQEDRRRTRDLKKLEDEKRDIDARKLDAQRQLDARKDDLDRLDRIRKAPTRADQIKELFDGDDEAVAETYLEIEKKLSDEKKDVTPEQKMEALVEKKAKAMIDAFKAEQAREQEARRMDYVQTETRKLVSGCAAIIEEKGEEFPLCYLAPPDTPLITAVAGGLAKRDGVIPSPEKVLREIEDYRASRDKRRKPETKPAVAAKESSKTPTRAAEAGGTTSAAKPNGKPPIRRNDAPVSPARPTASFDEDLDEEIKRLASIPAK